MARKLFFILAALMLVIAVSAKEEAAKAPAAADEIPEAGAVSPSSSKADHVAGGPIGETAVDGDASGVAGLSSDSPTGAPATGAAKSSASSSKVSAALAGAAAVAGSFFF